MHAYVLLRVCVCAYCVCGEIKELTFLLRGGTGIRHLREEADGSAEQAQKAGLEN